MPRKRAQNRPVAVANAGQSYGGPEWPAHALWPLDQILPYPQNARVHPPEQVSLLAAQLRRWGPDQPIVVDEHNVILKGHGRLAAAREAGLTAFPVVQRFGLSETEKKAIRIADNQIALLSSYDDELMKLEIGELKLADFDVPLLGFSEQDLREFGVALGTDGKTDPDEVPEPLTIPVTERGDLWLLGGHRLLCGDATSESDVAMCLGEAEPHLMVTDPPWGVEYDPAWRDRELKDAWTAPRAVGAVQADDKADWTSAWRLFNGDVVYAWCPAGTTQIIHHNSLAAAGFELRMQIIWAKQHYPIGRGNYHVQHEPCWYAVRKGKPAYWQGDRTQSTVWPIANASAMGGRKDDVVSGHSTQKPIECMRRPMENNSAVGDAVYDPFVGSGTSIIAAEMTKRRCMAIEIHPAYVDVSVLRWQKFTGNEAVLEKTGRTFAETKAERGSKPCQDNTGNQSQPVPPE